MKKLLMIALMAMGTESNAQINKQTIIPCQITSAELLETRRPSDPIRLVKVHDLYNLAACYTRVFLIGSDIDPKIGERYPNVHYIYEDPCFGHVAVMYVIPTRHERSLPKTTATARKKIFIAKKEFANSDIFYRSNVSKTPTANINDIAALSLHVCQPRKGAEVRTACSKPGEILYVIDGMRIARN